MSSGGDTPGDGLSTLQNGAAAYSQSLYVSRICQGGFLLPFIFLSVLW